MKSAQELGAALRAARHAKKLEIGELSEKTGLPERYLKALESGDHSALPGKAYARIYFLTYARALDLETEHLMLDWPHPEGDPSPPLSIQPPNPWPRRFLILIGIAVVAVTAYSVWQSRKIDSPPAQPSKAVPAVLDSELVPDAGFDTTIDTTGSSSDSSDTVTSSASPGQSEQPVAAPPSYVLEVNASGQSWVVIEADGDTVDARVLPGGGTMRAEAQRDFVLTATRPEVVRVLLDGRDVSLPQDRTRPLIRHRIDPKAQGGTP